MTLRLEDGRIEVRDLAIDERSSGQRAVSIPAFDIEGLTARYPEQSLRIARIHSSGGDYHMQRLADGRFRVQRLLESQAGSPTEAEQGHRATAVVAQPTPPVDGAPSWHVAIDEIDLDAFRLVFEDRSTSEPVMLELDPITLGVRGLTNEPGKPAEIDLEIVLQQTGRTSTEQSESY